MVLEEREQVLLDDQGLFDAFAGNPAATVRNDYWLGCNGGFARLRKVVPWHGFSFQKRMVENGT